MRQGIVWEDRNNKESPSQSMTVEEQGRPPYCIPHSPLRQWAPSSETVVGPREQWLPPAVGAVIEVCVGHSVTKEGRVSRTREVEGRLPEGGGGFTEPYRRNKNSAAGRESILPRLAGTALTGLGSMM